jgi:SAM-dependent methyltransferase
MFVMKGISLFKGITMGNAIDWNELWMQDFTKASWRKDNKNLSEMWDRKADNYNRKLSSRFDTIEKILKKIDVGINDTIIDIGCGPGTLTIPLSLLCSQITAVDPSPKMLKHIKKKAATSNINNILYVNKKWEDVVPERDLEKSDIVIACHCLIMEEMKEALHKMNNIAAKKVYLFRFAGRSGWDLEELWPQLCDTPYQKNPDYIYIVNILHQMGIYADVEILRNTTKRIFDSIEEAADDIFDYIGEVSDSAREVVRNYMQDTLEYDNGIYFKEEDSEVAMISFEK